MDKINYSSLGPAGGDAGGVIENVVSSARGTVCTLYQNYQAWYHQNVNSQTPVGHVLEQFWDKVCPNVPSYTIPPSQPGFNGGQCPFQYDVRVRVATSGGYLGYRGTAMGPIAKAFKTWTSWTSGLAPPGVDIQNASGTKVGEVGWTGEVVGDHDFRGGAATIISVVPVNGQPDTCGNLPGNPPPPSPPPQINTDIDVYGPNGSTYKVPISINPKIVIAKDLVGIDVQVGPVEFSPSVNPQFSFNPNVSFNPNLNLNFGLGGVNPSFTLPNVSTGGGTSGNANLSCDICAIADAIKNDTEEVLDILKYQHTYSAHSLGTGSNFIQDNIVDLAYVEVVLTKLPTTTKIVFSESGVDSMYTGWIHFRKAGKNFEKQQLTSASSVLYCPVGSDGFNIQLTHNSLGSCTYFTRQ